MKKTLTNEDQIGYYEQREQQLVGLVDVIKNKGLADSSLMQQTQNDLAQTRHKLIKLRLGI